MFLTYNLLLPIIAKVGGQILRYSEKGNGQFVTDSLLHKHFVTGLHYIR